MTSIDFTPPRSRGQTVHTTLIVVLVAIGVILAVLASRQPIDLVFVAYVASAVFVLFLISLLAYRLYSLRRANYRLEQDKLILSWGLRVEQISVSDIEWVRPWTALADPLPKPFFRLPGAVLGVRRHPDLGPVEFLASEEKSLLLVATPRRIFAISPEDPSDFLQHIQRVIEMGGFAPTPSQSLYPTFVVGQAWTSAPARFLWLAGLLLNIGLLVWVIFLAPSLGPISLGFLPSGAARTPVAGLGLILLPAVGLFFYLISWVVGLIIYRRESQHSMAYVVWAGGVFSALLFLAAVLWILTTPVSL